MFSYFYFLLHLLCLSFSCVDHRADIRGGVKRKLMPIEMVKEEEFESMANEAEDDDMFMKISISSMGISLFMISK